MGNCCVIDAKPTLNTAEMQQIDAEKTSEELISASAALLTKQATMQTLQNAVSSLRTQLKSTTANIHRIQSDLNSATEQAKDQFAVCIRLLTRISVLQILAINVKSEEFRGLLLTKTLDDLVVSLLESRDVQVGRQTRSVVMSEIRASTLRVGPGENDVEAIRELSEEKAKSQEMRVSLAQLCAEREEMAALVTQITKQRAALLKETTALSNDILFFKDRKQDLLVKWAPQEGQLKGIKDKLSPISLIQSLFSLENDDFTLAGELSASSTELKYLENTLKSASGSEFQAEKLLIRIEQLPVPKPVPRPAVSVLGVAPKVVSDDSDIDLMEEEMSEERGISLQEQLKSLKNQLKDIKRHREEEKKESLRIEEQLEANDFNKAELALKLIATRLIHRVKLERIWLLSAWRVASITQTDAASRPASRLILG
jgi:hypothetical protein